MSPAKHAFSQVKPHNRVPKQSLSCGTQVSGGRRTLKSAGASGELTEWRELLPLRAVLTGASPYEENDVSDA